MPPSSHPQFSVPTNLQPGGKILLILVTVLGGKCATAGGNFESRITSVSNLPILLPLLLVVNHLPATEARVSAKERGAAGAGGQKVGPLL